ATAIRIDRLFEGHVRRVVAADDRAGAFFAHRRGRPRSALRFVLRLRPAVVLRAMPRRLEPSLGIAERAASLVPDGRTRGFLCGHGRTVRHPRLARRDGGLPTMRHPGAGRCVMIRLEWRPLGAREYMV